jgi:hypothetical protein
MNYFIFVSYFVCQSLEGLYQESGRAGRDGLQAHCLLYFCYADKARLQSMTKKGKQNMDSYETLNGHLTAITRVVEYCENVIDCRRQLVLQYFNENFDPSACNGLEKKKSFCFGFFKFGETFCCEMFAVLLYHSHNKLCCFEIVVCIMIISFSQTFVFVLF